MFVRIITLRYDSNLAGFSDMPVREVLARAKLLEFREHFFMHEGLPHLACIMVLDDFSNQMLSKNSHAGIAGEDAETIVPDSHKPLYKLLRRWRNETARKEGIPSYIILRNKQLAQICCKLPSTIADLKEIEGVGESTCVKYGRDVLAIIAQYNKNLFEDEHKKNASAET